MSKHYKHLSKEERDRLAILRGQGLSIRGIADQIDSSPSTISRELRRNADRSSPDGYLPHPCDDREERMRIIEIAETCVCYNMWCIHTLM